MARNKYLDILSKRGINGWNEWRKDNLQEEVDLSYVDLQGVNLAGGYFWKTNFSKSNLTGVNFYKADLTSVNFTEAILRGSDFRETDLSYLIGIRADFFEAKLSKANLQNANLREASFIEATLSSSNLSFANFTGSNLQKTDLNNAQLAYTIFGDTDLRGVKNLDSCDFLFPSIIDQMTLLKSGRLPKKFLSGCGLSEAFIHHIPTLFGTSSPNKFHSCFISYSHADKKFAQFLYKALKKEGVPCWLDEELLPGMDIREKINEVINLSDKLLLCCSKSSLNDSRWVDREINRALAKEDRLSAGKRKNVQVLIPLDLDKYIFSNSGKGGKSQDILDRYIADFTGWKRKTSITPEYKKLIKALRVN